MQEKWVARAFSSLPVLVALAVSPAALAEGEHDRGWLVGGGWGEADYGASVSDFDDGSITSGRVDNSELAWKLFGGYRVNRLFSVEAGTVDLVNDYDSPTFEGISDGSGSFFVSFPDGPVSVGLKPGGYFAEGVGSLPLGKSFFAFGKLGLMQWHNETTVQDLRGETVTEENGTDVVYGVGFEYRFKFGLSLRGEYEVFTDVAGHDIGMGSGGVSWTF